MPAQPLAPTARLAGFLAAVLGAAGQPVRAEDGNIVYAEVAVEEVAEIDAIVQAAIGESVADDDSAKGDLLLLHLVNLSPEALSRLAAWDRQLPQVSVSDDGDNRFLSVPKAIFDRGDGANDDRLRASFDFPLLYLPSRVGEWSSQQVVPREVADEVLTLLLNTPSTPSTPQETACAEASNRLGSVQKLVPDKHVDAAAIAAFDLACLGTIFPAQEFLAAPSYIQNSGAIRIVGVLERAILGRGNTATREEFCSAFLVDNNTIVSARHCFYDVQRPTARTDAGEAWDSGDVYFRRMVPPFASVKVGPQLAVNWLDGDNAENLSQSQLPLSAADDFIAFTLADAIPGIPEVRFDADESLQQAWVGGPAGIVRDGAIIDAGIPRSVSGFRWTRNAPCATAARSDACALHICHVTKGASGAALVGSSSNAAGVAITGIHLGPYDELGIACPAMRSTLQVNLNGAVRAPAFMIQILAARGADDRSN